MFARVSAPRVLLRQHLPTRTCLPCRPRIHARRLSSTNAGPIIPQPSAHPLAGVATQLDHVAPRFELDASQIEIINSPTAFYETLKNKIRKARYRVYLSTLYIGKNEHDLIDAIREALRNNPKLEVSILTDALRGTREDPKSSCASLLAPLITEFGSRVKIAMYHTPNLNGWKKKHMPKRLNEGWGLQHMKLYGFDDEILLSGANLSEDYFTNRLDRYHLFKSKELADFYASIHDAVSDISYELIPSKEKPAGFELLSPIHRGLPDPVWHSDKYRKYAKKQLEPLIRPRARQKIVPLPFDQHRTFVYPLAQFDDLLGQPRPAPYLNYEFEQLTSTEKPALTKLLQALSEEDRLRNASWTFTAGYFNIDPDIRDLLLAAAPHLSASGRVGGQSTPSCTVITASPWANGFYGSSGVSGMLPAAYTLLSRRFLRDVEKAGLKDVIQLKEWRRGTVGEPGGFTYHAKGIWVTLPPRQEPNVGLIEEEGPSITVIGSSNYTKRSYSLDLEIGALVITGDHDLKRKLRDEVAWLSKDATVTTQDDLMKIDRRVGARVRAALWLVEALGGAL